jgi:hypothetical protein
MASWDVFASMGWRHIGRFVLDEPRQFSSRFGPGSLPAESVVRMLTTIKVVGIGSATNFPIPDAHDSTQGERGMTRVGNCVLERFPDREVAVQILECVRRKEVFLMQPTSPPTSDHLIELLTLADACRRAGRHAA